MINVTMYRNVDDRIYGFCCEGHAEFDEPGFDIVCASVSALVFNCMNSIESFTSDTFDFEEDDDIGKIDFKIISPISNVSELLLNSLLLGLDGIEEQYGEEYVKINS